MVIRKNMPEHCFIADNAIEIYSESESTMMCHLAGVFNGK